MTMEILEPFYTKDSLEPNSSFRVIIGGKRILIKCKYKTVLTQCRDYLAAFDKSDFDVCCDPQISRRLSKCIMGSYSDVHFDKVAIRLGADALEALNIYFGIAKKMLEYDTLLLHGAAISINKRGYIFIGPSGIGKTTHILNWKEMIPKTIVVNGDKPLVNIKENLIYGSPWCGKEGFNTNISVQLCGIIILERCDTNSIEKITFDDCINTVLQQVYLPEEPLLKVRAIKLINRLKDTQFYRLKCNKNKESAIVSYTGLLGCVES